MGPTGNAALPTAVSTSSVPTASALPTGTFAMTNVGPPVDLSSEDSKVAAAKRAALEIQASLNEPARVEAEASKLPGALLMGTCTNWNILGYGILRSQTNVEVFVYKEDLKNCDQLAVGDTVTFEMGGGDFFFKNQKPKALNCVKVGAAGNMVYQPGGIPQA